MRFHLVVQGAAATGQAATTALQFARAALAAGHALGPVLFHGDGASAVAAPATGSDEPDPVAGWRELAAAHGFALVACATAAERRGASAAAGGIPPGTLGEFMAALDGGRESRTLAFAD